MSVTGSTWQDLRYAARSLRKDRGSVALALLALALGIGATTIIFSVVYSVLIDPFPYKDSSQLVHIYIHGSDQTGPYGRNGYTVKEFFDFKAQNHVFSDMMAGNSMDVVYKIGNTTYRTDGGILDPGMFAGLGVKPELGREITESDGEPGAPPVFVMSDRMWHEKFNRDPKVLGTTLTLNGVQRTLVSIMPPRFLLLGADVWIPMKITTSLTADVVGGPAGQPLYVWTVARLKPGVSLKQAAAEMEVIAHNEAKTYPDLYPKQFKVLVGTIADLYTRGLRTMIYILLGAVIMLLLIACSNVANLLLARATAREKELAVRATIGATRGRLIRQLLAESFVLASTGAVIGCGLAYAGLQWVKATIPPDTIPSEVEIKFNAIALLGTLAITLVTSLLCGLAPALRAARGDLHTRLMGTGKGVGASSGHGRLRTALVALQVGLAIVLLVGAGLMMRTFFALDKVDVGFNPKNILVARVVFPSGQYKTAASKQSFFRQILPRLGALPGVSNVTVSMSTPVENGASTDVTVPGTTHSQTWNSTVELVSEDYFKTVGVPLLRGRLLTAAEIDSARTVAVVNKRLVHDFFGDQDPIGRTIKFNVLDRIPDSPHNAYFEIVGVVGDVRNNNLEKDTTPEAFIPHTITSLADDTLLLRTNVPPESVVPNLRDVVSSVDSNVAFGTPQSLEAILHHDYMAAPEFGLTLLAIFAGIGLILSAIGVFSVMAYTVSLQTHDIGIRMALGAQPKGVMRMVLLKGLQPIAVGVAVGLAASYGVTRVMTSQIYGVTPTDPLTYGGVVFVLAAVGMAACLLPARRATQVDPLIALRYE
jgi:putative ABC transport system permease protein